MTAQYTGGSVPLSTWQLKLAQRVGGLEPGVHLFTVTVLGGTVEPCWAIMGSGKVENRR
jgi:hypothetical protein